MDNKGNLDKETIKRLEKAACIFKKNESKYILTSGWAYRDDCKISLADAAKVHLVKFFEIPRRKIITEKNSRDTVGDAYFSKVNKILKKNLKSIVVVTSLYHVPRVKKIFSFIYGKNYIIKVVGVKSDRSNFIKKYEKKSLKVFCEMFKKIEMGNTKSIFKKMQTSHPYYNGTLLKKNNNKLL